MPADETITGHATLTAMDQFRAFWWGGGRFVRIAGVLALIGLALLLVLLGFASEDDTETLATPLLMLIVFVVMWPIIILWGHRRMSSEQREISYEIDRQQVAWRDATGALFALPWSVLRHVAERKSGFVFAVRPAGARWIPRRAFTPKAAAALRRLARAKLGKAARVRGD